MSFISRSAKPYFERSITPLIELLYQIRVHPNLITLCGLLLVGVGSLALYAELKWVALILLSAGALLDAVDGTLARRSELHSDFGAFLDSTVDRVSDALPFVALGVLYAERGEPLLVILAFLALISSYLVSYARAKAESVGVFGLGGAFERAERWVILVLGLLLDLLPLALLIISLGSMVTVGQRVYEVKKVLDRRLS